MVLVELAMMTTLVENEWKEDVREVESIWEAAEYDVSPAFMASSTITDIALYYFNPTIMVGVVGAVGGWLAARQGRKVRLRVHDKEFEAGSVKELKELITLAEHLIDHAAAQADPKPVAEPVEPCKRTESRPGGQALPESGV